VAATLCNCCYETTDHDWLLFEVGMLGHLLLPLAGPEEFTSGEKDGMEPFLLDKLAPLGSDKVREPDMETRRCLFSALHLLACSKTARQYMRRKRAYPVIRNADLAETEEALKELVLKVIQFLIT
jgi:hypothetical protein